MRAEIELADTPTSRALLKAVPFESKAQTWGEDRTPMSSDERPRLASPCNVLGRLVGDPRRLDAVRPGEKVSVEKA
jgi:hypothetical protein